ncbi:hypothetical protein ABFS83_07G016900 [Erythranthe nasuta]
METSSLAAVVGGIVGVLTLTLLITLSLCYYFFVFRFRNVPNKDSETASSDPSAAETAKRGGGGPHEAKQFRIEELEQATRHFNESNLIGCGIFGLVFKGLLSDGTVVAIKRRNGPPREEFVEEVANLSEIRHRNLVALLGYCQERGCQMLVFEYLPNGSMCSHLYETGKSSITKLEFKQRMSIAIGAAKAGLSHLHGLRPPLLHGNFRTANVLVDENFIAKVADAGVLKLLERIEDASSSSTSSFNAFKDPELGQHGVLHETNDIYSFGIFLLELLSGKEATYQEAFRSNDTTLQWVQEEISSNNLVDQRLTGSFTEEGMRDFIKIMIKCVSFPSGDRPRMEYVVSELDQILDCEITRTTVMGEGTATVTLGSQLFTN